MKIPMIKSTDRRSRIGATTQQGVALGMPMPRANGPSTAAFARQESQRDRGSDGPCALRLSVFFPRRQVRFVAHDTAMHPTQ
jgi:hypothetical protein